MKKFLALAIVAVMTVALFAVGVQAEDFSYAHFVASGDDPCTGVTFSGAHTAMDPDAVKWAAIKYRTVSEKDSGGNALTGQIYVQPAQEPCVKIEYNHTQKWETLVLDLSGCAAWNSEKYTQTGSFRFDFLQGGQVQDGDSIDIAWIAFFEKEADAKAYDGTQDTPYCVSMPTELAAKAGTNQVKSIDIVAAEAPAEQPAEQPADATKPLTVDLSGANGSSVDVEIKDGKVVCTTNGGDPWVSIPLDNVDTSVYKYVTVTYTATKEVGTNNTYLMDTSVNPGYSGTQGTWAPNGMGGTADGAQHSKTYEIAADFPAMAGTTLTGIRFTCCGENDGVFTVESVVFHATETIGDVTPDTPVNPSTADASVIAIAAVACVALAGVVIAKKVK